MELKMNYKIQGEWLSLTLDCHLYLDDLFNALCINKKTRYLLRTEHKIQIGHEYITTNPLLKKGSTIRLKVIEKTKPDFISQNLFPLNVVYEDSLILIVNKPKGYLVHPDKKDGLGTLYNVVSHYYHMHKIQRPIRAIHRLDKQTSGLVLFCKIPFLQPYFDNALSKKEIKRYYRAEVEGIIHEDFLDINQPIGKDRHENNKYCISSTGKSALTHCQVVERKQQTTIVDLELETGRTHQIRVHLKSINHPIVGDELYGTKADEMKLHAYALSFIHPFTKERIQVETA